MLGNKPKFFEIAYSNSKLCNIYCTYELDRRLKDSGKKISVNAFDPGLVPGTGLARDYGAFVRFAFKYIAPYLPMDGITPEKAGKALARLVLDPKLEGVSGKYFHRLEEKKSSVDSYDTDKAKELWEESTRMTQLKPEEMA